MAPPVFAQGSGARASRKEVLARRLHALSRSPLFSELSKRQLRALARTTDVAIFEPGEAIVTEGESDSRLFVILDGQARVLRDGRTVARFWPGDFFGEISVIDGGPRTATVLAEQQTRCLTLGGDHFRRILAEEPTIAVKILRELARRVRQRERLLTG